MPRSPKSPIDELQNGELPKFAGYDDRDREAIANVLIRAASDPKPNSQDLKATIAQIEDLGMDYLARKRVIPDWPPPHELRKQLDRLCRAIQSERFKKAARSLHSSLWISILVRAKGLPTEIERQLLDPAPPIETLTPYARNIRKAASQFLIEIEDRKRERGPRKNVLVAWFAWALIPLYEAATRREARVSYVGMYWPTDYETWKGRTHACCRGE